MTGDIIPELSVVVPAVNGWGDLEGCLGALRNCTGDHEIEIIVANRLGDEIARRVAKQPDVVLLEASDRTTIPELRAMAFRVAKAEVVAVIEDHVLVPAKWATEMLQAHARGARVVGGSVQNAATDRMVDIAAFLCEYSHCLSPPVGASDWVVGNNVSYRRELLEEFRDTIEEHHWENRLHDAFKRGGVTLLSCPEIEVGHKKHYSVSEYAYQRYLYSRSYAGMRVEGAGALKRAAYGAAAFALPPLLLQRLVARVWKTGKYRKELMVSIPLLTFFMSSWALGEVVGSWFGPGDALGKVC